jgi:hypothetical protein
MKSRLLQTLQSIIELLDLCSGLDRQVDWIRSRMVEIEKAEDSIPVLKQYAEELRAIITGMGSFTDLALEPRIDAGISEKAANRRKWELADQLDEITGQVLK